MIGAGIPFFLILFAASVAKAEDARPANRLIREKSPYLLQHAHNPVDWYPWSAEAFAKAAKEDKPVFLSIGYSTCHWCHVMEAESFEDPATAEILNKNFVAIKVDREERPDLDSVYMNYVMATTGSGGWPMSVFLTPDKKPFYGGTYFPPEDRYGMPGFKTLLNEIADAWKTRRSEILTSADSAAKFLAEKSSGGGNEALTEAMLKTAAGRFEAIFEPAHGGFGRAPKFPRSPVVSFLFRQWLRTGDRNLLEMGERTLMEMARGGIYDQLGGGFHRYSTDNFWRIPHFEKMLYDQALLVVTYLEAYQITRKPFYARVARETLDYVLREMTSPEGGFYSAQDADSLDPATGKKSEGVFFLWTTDEIARLFKPDEAAIIEYSFGIEPAGNAPQDPHGEFKEKNVLYLAHSADETAAHFKRSVPDVENIIDSAKKRLFDVRKSRPLPHLDDKVLTDWNGLMIAAFAQASRTFGEPPQSFDGAAPPHGGARYREAAVKAADFIDARLRGKSGELLHRWRDGDAAIEGTLNDYAFFLYAEEALYEATFDARWLAAARKDADAMIDLFWDDKAKGFFLTSKRAEALFSRPKEIYDGAVPSGNSVAALALLRLEHLTGEMRYGRYADDTLRAFADDVTAEPSGYPEFLIALDFAVGPVSEIVMAGRPDDPALSAALAALGAGFFPNSIALFHPAGPEAKAIEEAAPFLKEKNAIDGKMTFYVCRDHACRLPTTDVDEMKRQLSDAHVR